MHCSANRSRKNCAQGHQPCPTPYTCNYTNDAHEQAMTRPLYAPLRDEPLPISLECPEPPEPMQLTRRDFALVIAFVSLVIGYAVLKLMEIL